MSRVTQANDVAWVRRESKYPHDTSQDDERTEKEPTGTMFQTRFDIANDMERAPARVSCMRGPELA
jgi:hypothetical protein